MLRCKVVEWDVIYSCGSCWRCTNGDKDGLRDYCYYSGNWLCSRLNWDCYWDREKQLEWVYHSLLDNTGVRDNDPYTGKDSHITFDSLQT